MMFLNKKHRYIAIEGNIGAGKTSLAHKLSRDSGAMLILEEFAENSFLPKFYSDQAKYAFPLELSFLAARYKQLNHFLRPAENNLIISDYHIRKSLLFAQHNLDPEELLLYQSFYEIVTSQIPEPDLVIYLKKDVSELQTNINNRGRKFENDISEDYLSGIQKAYHSLMQKNPFKQLLIIDAENIDFINNENDYLFIINKLKSIND